ncbi:MAG TPA: hypothetical protein VLY04_00695 [Bryobacteraceae bacterium]|nr:hypothetical protein [Bryobacteraceae bacterium]
MMTTYFSGSAMRAIPSTSVLPAAVLSLTESADIISPLGNQRYLAWFRRMHEMMMSTLGILELPAVFAKECDKVANLDLKRHGLKTASLQ